MLNETNIKFIDSLKTNIDRKLVETKQFNNLLNSKFYKIFIDVLENSSLKTFVKIPDTIISLQTDLVTVGIQIVGERCFIAQLFVYNNKFENDKNNISQLINDRSFVKHCKKMFEDKKHLLTEPTKEEIDFKNYIDKF